MFEHLPPVPDDAVYAPLTPTRIPTDLAISIITEYARLCSVTDVWIEQVTTGHGGFTAHHFDDSDYIVHLGVVYADMPGRTCTAVYGVRNSRADLWLN